MAQPNFKVGQLIQQSEIADKFYQEFSGTCLVVGVVLSTIDFHYYTLILPGGTKCDVSCYQADRRFKALDA